MYLLKYVQNYSLKNKLSAGNREFVCDYWTVTVMSRILSVHCSV